MHCRHSIIMHCKLSLSNTLGKLNIRSRHEDVRGDQIYIRGDQYMYNVLADMHVHF